MKTAVITPVRGRHDHLLLQHQGLAAGAEEPDHYIVVAMDDPDLDTAHFPAHPRACVLRLPVTTAGLPLARARNTGAGHALDQGAELLIFLDVDCVPGHAMLRGYRDACLRQPGPGLYCGTVSYLPPPTPDGYRLDELPHLAHPHAARPVPEDGQILESQDYSLFWSLSFAASATTWQRIGGFHEHYQGYGGEDTDFAQLARQADIPLYWIGGAPAYHQHHPVEQPPTSHLDDILRNARIFHDRWGWWPMEGWLDQFATLGLAHYEPDREAWVRR